MKTNPYAATSGSTPLECASSVAKPPIGRVLVTGAVAVGITLCVWILIVMVLDRPMRGYDHLLWSGSLWFSALWSTFLVSRSRFSRRPTIGCAFAFGVFSLVFVVCEGTTFGVASEGGSPHQTSVVIWNLITLPLGVFIIAELAQWTRRHGQRSGGDVG